MTLSYKTEKGKNPLALITPYENNPGQWLEDMQDCYFQGIPVYYPGQISYAVHTHDEKLEEGMVYAEGRHSFLTFKPDPIGGEHLYVIGYWTTDPTISAKAGRSMGRGVFLDATTRIANMAQAANLQLDLYRAGQPTSVQEQIELPRPGFRVDAERVVHQLDDDKVLGEGRVNAGAGDGESTVNNPYAELTKTKWARGDIRNLTFAQLFEAQIFRMEQYPFQSSFEMPALIRADVADDAPRVAKPTSVSEPGESDSFPGTRRRGTFRSDLAKLVNFYSIDSKCDTPDFVLANFIGAVVESFGEATKATNDWMDR